MHIKKLFVLLLFLGLFLSAPTTTYANSIIASAENIQNQVVLNVSTDESISTFDTTRTISGTSEPGASIAITVYKTGDTGALVETVKYEIEVGSTGLFSQAVKLNLGLNTIIITAEKDDQQAQKQIEIRRKSLEVKRELESGIVLPGYSITTP